MVRISVEINSGAACFTVAVCAESIRRAMSLVQDSYPGGELRMLFPVDPETFFAPETDAAGVLGMEMPLKQAG